MGGNQSCGTACCSDAHNNNEIKGLRAKAPGLAAPGLRMEAPTDGPTSHKVYGARPQQGDPFSPYSAEDKTDAAAAAVERDGGLVLGFRLPDGSRKALHFGTRKPPLGMDFTKGDPVKIKRVRQSSPAEQLG